MDFALTEEQEALKKDARSFLEGECTETFIRKMAGDAKGYSPALWRKMASRGWLGLAIPAKYGGKGKGPIEMATLHGEMGRAMLPGPYLSTATLCAQAILAAGNETQKSEFLKKIASGKLVLALTLTEAGGGWDASDIAVQATRAGDDYLINGTKLFAHDAHIADYLLCVTRTAKGKSPEQGITMFLVDAKSKGISQTLLRTTAGDNLQSEVVFKKVKVPAGNMLGKLNKGWAPLEKVLQLGAVMLSAEMAGANERLLELTVDYGKTRVQFDEPIGVNQYIQEHCVNLLSNTDSCWWLTHQAAWKLSEGLPCDMDVAMAKAWTSDACAQACWYAHQVFAGIGYLEEEGVLPLYTRRGKVAQLYLGDSAHHRKKVASQMDGWSLEMPTGKALGIFEKDQIPAWTR